MDTKTQAASSNHNFPPVVSVLGHVDHGKTSLLDAIRSTDVVSREHGGITQRIGASKIEIDHEGKKRSVTFIDTPGHEAFFTMRAQGVSASDIALLVVAADDGIKPQTKESIEKIKESKIPFIVVITKIDKETAQIEKVKQMILGEGILLEGLGGEVPYIGVSSKTGDKIKDLLDLVLLVYDMHGIKKEKNAPFMGVVIDSKMDKRRGAVSTVIVRQGSLEAGGKLYKFEKELGKIRALFGSNGQVIKIAEPGDAAEILGLTQVLETGSLVWDKPQSPEVVKKEVAAASMSSQDLRSFFDDQEKEDLSIILKAETSGEMDAVKSSLPEGIKIASEGQGEVSIADMLLAKDLKALVIGFNVGISKEAKNLADSEGIFYKNYTIIYELLDEMKDAFQGLNQEEEVKIRGRGEILAEFPTAVGKILGTKVTEGRLALNDPVIITRDDVEVGRSKIVLLKRGKAEVKEVGRGLECGVTVSPIIDFQVGDVILSCSDKRK